MHTGEQTLEEMNLKEQEGSEHTGLYTELDLEGQREAGEGGQGTLTGPTNSPGERWGPEPMGLRGRHSVDAVGLRNIY